MNTQLNSRVTQIAKLCAAAVVMSAASSGFAATWQLAGIGGLCGGDNSTTTNTTVGCGAGLSASGYSTGTGAQGTTGTTANFTNTAGVMNYGGAGIGLRATNDVDASGPHAFDNVNGVDALLLNFSTKTNLNSVQIGWSGTNSGAIAGYTDSDFSVFAWTGAAAAPSFATVGPGGLTAAGWTLVGNYADLLANAAVSLPAAAATAIFSSYWLISAYDTSYGSTSSNGGSLSGTNDSFKLLQVAGNTTCTGTIQNNAGGGGICKPGGNQGGQVPEPGSLALFGAAMIGFVASRRRKAATV